MVHGTGLERLPTDCTVPHRMHLPTDVDLVMASVRPQVVFHLAAPVNPDCVEDIRQTRDAIVTGSAMLAEACARSGARLVHIGTCAEYGCIPTPYREDHICEPVGVYGEVKYAATRAISESSAEWVVVRPFRAIGPGDMRSVVAAAARAAIEEKPFEMTDGLQIREWNHVDAIAKAIVAAGAHPGAVRHIINVGGGPRLSVLDVVRHVFQVAGTDVDLVRPGRRSRRPHEVDTLFGDHRKATKLWGLIQQPEMEQTLRVMLDEQRACTGVVA